MGKKRMTIRRILKKMRSEAYMFVNQCGPNKDMYEFMGHNWHAKQLDIHKDTALKDIDKIDYLLECLNEYDKKQLSVHEAEVERASEPEGGLEVLGTCKVRFVKKTAEFSDASGIS